MEVVDICSKFVRSETSDKDVLVLLNDLKEVVNVGSHEWHSCSELLLFSLRHVLSSHCSLASKEQVLSLLHVVLSSGHIICSKYQFLSLLQDLVEFLPPPSETFTANEETKRKITSEECSIALVQLLDVLFQNQINNKVSADIVMSIPLPMVAYVISSLLTISSPSSAKTSTIPKHNRELQVLSVKCLDSLLLLFSIEHHENLINAIAQFLPGIASRMAKIINGDYKQGSRLQAASVSCLAHAIQLTMNDESNMSLINKPEYDLNSIVQMVAAGDGNRTMEMPLSSSNYTKDEFKIFRNSTWLEDTGNNLKMLLIPSISKLLMHPSFLVKEKLVLLCCVVINQCQLSLPTLLLPAMEGLLGLLYDHFKEIRVSVKAELTKFINRKKCKITDWIDLKSFICGRFMDLVSEIPQKCRNYDEGEIVSIVQVLLGYIEVIDTDIQTTIEIHLNKILLNFSLLLAFDSIDLQLLTYTEYQTNNKIAAASGYYRKRFHYLRQENSVDLVRSVLHRLGSIADTALVIDHVIDEISTPSISQAESRKPELVFILNQLLIGASGNISSGALVRDAKTCQLDIHLIGLLFERIFQLQEWNKRSCDEGTSMIVSLFLEGMGNCAQAIGIMFKDLLVHSLYPIVEKLGSNSKLVEQSSLSTLQRVSAFCGYNSISALLNDNVDYVIDSLSSKLSLLNLYPSTPFVVEGLLKHSVELPLIHDIVQAVIKGTDTYWQSEHIFDLLRVMRAIIGAIAKYHSDKCVEDTDESNFAKSKTYLNNLVSELNSSLWSDYEAEELLQPEDTDVQSYFENYHEELGLENKDTKISNSEEDENKKCRNPFHKYIIQIMNRCRYFVSSDNTFVQCISLNIMQDGVLALSKANCKIELLPAIHEIWPSLIPRFHHDNKAVVLASLRLLQSLAITATDFIGDRFIKHGWPSIEKQLNNIQHFEALSKKDLYIFPVENDTEVDRNDKSECNTKDFGLINNGGYTLTLDLLCCLLATTRVVCENSESATKLVWDIAQCCLKYLKMNVNTRVQQEALQLFKSLIKLNADEMFVLVAAMALWIPEVQPNRLFKVVPQVNCLEYYRSVIRNPDSKMQSNGKILLNYLTNDL